MGAKEYFSEYYNLYQLFHFVFFIGYFSQRIIRADHLSHPPIGTEEHTHFKHGDELLPNGQPNPKFDGVYVPGEFRMTYFIIANSVLITFSIADVLIFLALFDKFGLLLVLLNKVTAQLQYFMVVFVIVICLFSALFQTAGINVV